MKSEAKENFVTEDPEKLREILNKSKENPQIAAGILVDWLSTLSSVVHDIGSSGKYKFQVRL